MLESRLARSVHNIEEAKEAIINGADYLGIGAVFSTSTKLDVKTISYDKLKEICDAVDVPTVAIGGISKDNIVKQAGSGVDGVAVVSAIFAAKDPGKVTRELKEQVVKCL